MITIDFTTKPKEIAPEYVVNAFGYKCTRDEKGKYHSYNDQPAIIFHNGTKEWCQHGKTHRDNNLPAIVWPNGKEVYWENGKRIK